jgi:ABC-type Fe3+/spermidine/putrescine transport system ATPase subunit
MVFQNYALWPHMTVYENVAFGLRERKVSKVEMERRVTQALEQVDLKGTERRRPSQLSGGQQQRVALARTLVIQPRALLLDEPLSNLDAKLRAEMRLELLKLQRELGITTIYVTHDQDEALALSTRIAVMKSGRIVQEGSPSEIYEEPRDRFVAEFVGKSNLFLGTIVHASDSFLEVETNDGLRIRAAAPVKLQGLRKGEKVILNVRPEALRLKRPGENSSETNQLSGKVSALAYQGSSVEYEIDVRGRALKAHVVKPKGRPLLQRGDVVEVVFAAENVSLVHGEF